MTQRNHPLLVPLLAAALAISGCVTMGAPELRTFEDKKPLAAPAEPRQIAITRLISKLPAGFRVGTSSGGLLCVPQAPMTWRPGLDEGVTGEVITGNPVFAIGTPLHERFSRTLTKGVVSALRPRDGRTIIQSDVVVHAGSSGGALLDEQARLVGLVISGVALGGQIGVGLNEFLGIDDAWRALQVEPQINTVEASSLIRR